MIKVIISSCKSWQNFSENVLIEFNFRHLYIHIYIYNFCMSEMYKSVVYIYFCGNPMRALRSVCFGWVIFIFVHVVAELCKYPPKHVACINKNIFIFRSLSPFFRCTFQNLFGWVISLGVMNFKNIWSWKDSYKKIEKQNVFKHHPIWSLIQYSPQNSAFRNQAFLCPPPPPSPSDVFCDDFKKSRFLRK